MHEHRLPDTNLKLVQEIHDEEVVEVLPYLGHFFRECILLNILGGFNMIKSILHTRVGTIERSLR
jgi:hypothetical protein